MDTSTDIEPDHQGLLHWVGELEDAPLNQKIPVEKSFPTCI